MQLVIDTTQPGHIKLELWTAGRAVAKAEKYTPKISESLLVETAKLLKKQGVKLRDLEKILVNPGPGGFSSTRTGIATANALSYALGIPLAEFPGGKIKTIVVPKYDKEPNITRPKSWK